VLLLDELVLAQASRIASRRTVARCAVVDGERSIDWKCLADASAAAAASLAASGVGRGDRVAVVAPNTLESVIAYLAVMRAGAVLVPIASDVRMPRLRAILEDCDPHALVAPRAMLAALRESIGSDSDGLDARWTELALDDAFAKPIGVPLGFGRIPQAPSLVARTAGVIDQDLAAIIYTSGTSGEPKGVMLTHANLVNTTDAIGSYLGQGSADEPDIVSCAVPIAFSYGLIQLLTALRSGSTVFLERSFAFPFDAMRRLERHGATVVIAVPTMVARMVAILPQAQVDLRAVRAVTVAAAALPAAHALRLLELLPQADLHIMYGQTECTRAATLAPELVRCNPGSVGRAIPNCELFLVDSEGRRLPPGRDGELVVRGANVSRGYWRRPVETAARFVEMSFGDSAIPERVLRTGDRFLMDRRGMLTFVGREDEIFKCRGEKVAPSMIERVLCAMPGVADAAVVGVPHEEDGTAIRALVVPAEGASLDERSIRARCRELLEPALLPRIIEICPQIPRTSNGKLLRRTLVAESERVACAV
jgi:amino acid adenylation domain-containing protein